MVTQLRTNYKLQITAQVAKVYMSVRLKQDGGNVELTGVERHRRLLKYRTEVGCIYTGTRILFWGNHNLSAVAGGNFEKK